MEPLPLYHALLGASLALSCVAILIVLREATMPAPLRAASVGLFVAGAAYTVAAGPVGRGLPPGFGPLLTALSATGVVLLWTIVRLLFDPRFGPAQAGRATLGLTLAGVGLPVVVAALWPEAKPVAMGGLAALAAALVIHLLWILVAGRADDLDGYRRALRLLLAGGGSLYVGLVLAAYGLGLLQGRPVGAALWLAGGQLAFKFAWLLLVLGAPSPATRLFGITQAAARSPLTSLTALSRRPAPPPAGDPPALDDTLARRQAEAILAAMTQQHLYRQQGLGIGRLAEHLRLPEHRVRALINGPLGFRNYSAFLNHFRLREVAQRLRDPAQAHLPILSIALDVGYASIAPFNRAFRDAFGRTPSEYRQAEDVAPADPDPAA